MTKQFTRWDSAEYLKTEEDMANYRDACMEEAGDDPAFIAKALGTIARARGMTQAALDAGLIRPVVVIRKHRSNSLLVTVVPLSTTAPDHMLEHHLELQSHLQGASPVCWAKCDMIATVSLSRLDRIKRRDRQGKRVYVISQLDTDEFYAIKVAVRKALGL